jgi:D-3-phosphoglycerate dehydrogenase
MVAQFQQRILLPQPIEGEAMDILQKAGCETILSPDPKPETVGPLMKEVQGVILRTGIKMTRELMGHGNDLRVISRTGAGYDNVDVEAATERGIIVTCVPGANTVSVAEHAVALILALMKYVPFMDHEVRRDNFSIRFKNLPRDLRGKTLGLVGLGRIGSEVARVGHHAFGMHILAHDPYLGEEAKGFLKGWVEFGDLERICRESDVISIHVPLLPSTRGLIGARELGWMKADAFLINTSRGGIIDEPSLVGCLRRRRIAGAALDVFAQEPLDRNNPLKELENIILTPHSAALTRECVVRLAVEAVQSALAVLRGEKPGGIVNPEAFKHPRWHNI